MQTYESYVWQMIALGGITLSINKRATKIAARLFARLFYKFNFPINTNP